MLQTAAKSSFLGRSARFASADLAENLLAPRTGDRSERAVTFFDRWRLRRAIRRYATQLPSALNKNYGASDSYTAPQIEATVRRLRLSPEFLYVGYAAFLPESDFLRVTAGMNLPIAYDDVRALFVQSLPHGGASGTWENPDHPQDWFDPASLP